MLTGLGKGQHRTDHGRYALVSERVAQPGTLAMLHDELGHPQVAHVAGQHAAGDTEQFAQVTGLRGPVPQSDEDPQTMLLGRRLQDCDSGQDRDSGVLARFEGMGHTELPAFVGWWSILDGIRFRYR